MPDCPSHIDIEQRMPTFEEFMAVRQAVGVGKTYESYELLKSAHAMYVAIDSRRRRAVGMARVMLDSLGWYSIWDVVVLPQYQSQRIGTALVETALGRLRQHSPGATVYLFTASPAFYTRLGFEPNDTMTLRL